MNTKRISANEYLSTTQPTTTIDLRTAAEYEQECIDGCIALPVQELNEARFKQVLDIAKHSEGPVHLLCQSGRRADMAIEKLRDVSTHELVIIDGGLNALKAAGAKTSVGTRKTISLERQVRIAAGALVLIGVGLGFTAHVGFFGLSAFVGAGLMFAGITDTCGMALMLAHMPWNKASKPQCAI